MARVRPAQPNYGRKTRGEDTAVTMVEFIAFQSNVGLALLYGGVSYPRQALLLPLRAVRFGCLRRGVGPSRNHRQTHILTMPRQKLTAQLLPWLLLCSFNQSFLATVDDPFLMFLRRIALLRCTSATRSGPLGVDGTVVPWQEPLGGTEHARPYRYAQAHLARINDGACSDLLFSALARVKCPLPGLCVETIGEVNIMKLVVCVDVLLSFRLAFPQTSSCAPTTTLSCLLCTMQFRAAALLVRLAIRIIVQASAAAQQQQQKQQQQKQEVRSPRICGPRDCRQ
jgi:hypothetical protein